MVLAVAGTASSYATGGGSETADLQKQLCESVYLDPPHPPSPRVIDEIVSFEGEEHPFTVLLPADYTSSADFTTREVKILP